MIKTFEKLFYLLFFRKSLLSKPDVSAYFDEMICGADTLPPLHKN